MSTVTPLFTNPSLATMLYAAALGVGCGSGGDGLIDGSSGSEFRSPTRITGSGESVGLLAPNTSSVACAVRMAAENASRCVLTNRNRFRFLRFRTCAFTAVQPRGAMMSSGPAPSGAMSTGRLMLKLSDSALVTLTPLRTRIASRIVRRASRRFAGLPPLPRASSSTLSIGTSKSVSFWTTATL